MLKSKVTLEQVIKDKVYHLVCDHDAPLLDVKEVLERYLNHVKVIEESIKAKAEAEAAQVKTECEPLKE